LAAASLCGLVQQGLHGLTLPDAGCLGLKRGASVPKRFQPLRPGNAAHFHISRAPILTDAQLTLSLDRPPSVLGKVPVRSERAIPRQTNHVLGSLTTGLPQLRMPVIR
jgi:hypothetical protein